MFVKNFMTPDVLTASPEQTLAAVLRTMDESGVRRLPVLHNGVLVGIVTKSDIFRVIGKAPVETSSPWEVNSLKVNVVMTRDPVTIGPEATLERAALLMLERKVSGLPVLENGRLVGIITESDIFKTLVRLLGFENRGARLTLEFGATPDILGAIRQRVAGLSLQSLVTYHDPVKNTWSVVARVRGRAAIEADLATHDRFDG